MSANDYANRAVFTQQGDAEERPEPRLFSVRWRNSFNNRALLKDNEAIGSTRQKKHSSHNLDHAALAASACGELEHARLLAIRNRQPAAAVAASMAKAKLTGLPTDGDHVGQQIIIAITADEAKL
jgi:hypothetical protein